MNNFDVIIVGGGVSGSFAAISAARNGAKTLLIEASGFPGGTLTLNSVQPMMTFHAGDVQTTEGLAQELIQKLINDGYSNGHMDDDNTSYTPFDQEGLKFTLEQMIVKSGVTILYHSLLADVNLDGNQIKNIVVCNKDGLRTYTASCYIDATGDGDLFVKSGENYTTGRIADGKNQPLTLIAQYVGIDRTKLIEYANNNRENFSTMDNWPLANKSIFLQGFLEEVAVAKEKGELTIPRNDILMFESSNQGEFYLNTTRLLNFDPTSALDLSNAEIEGRKQVNQLTKFLKKYVAGFKNSRLVSTGPKIGVRSSRQLIGEYVLTSEDILKNKKFPDAIAYTGYPIDIHSPSDGGTTINLLEWGTFYGIPLRCLIPKNTSNLLVTGRCISVSFEAQASMRTTPTAASIGEAAGVAASLVAKEEIDVKKLDPVVVRERLLHQGAYIV